MNTLEAPDLVVAPKTKWQMEHAAFLRLLPSLLSRYRGQYVLIHNEEVAAVGPDKLALALEFHRKNGPIPVHVGLVTDEPEPVARIPHFRLRNAGGSA